MLAAYDGKYYTAVNALSAYRQHMISQDTYFAVMAMIRDKMLVVGVEDYKPSRNAHSLRVE
jgi:hypothetical protein